jgi:hypothetical protein
MADKKGGTTNLFFLLFICLLVAGCATVPFEAEPKADLSSADPPEMLKAFDESVAQNFELLESVVFNFFGKDMTGMGYLSVNADDESYALSCMNPAGIKMFEFRGIGDEVETLFVPPQLEKHKERFAESVAQDIRRIYFDWIPSENAEMKRKSDKLVFTEKTENGDVEYVYAGPKQTLVEKKFSKGWKTHCRVRYFDYKEVEGKKYPYGIVLENRKYHYRLVLRVKSVHNPGP